MHHITDAATSNHFMFQIDTARSLLHALRGWRQVLEIAVFSRP